MTICNIARSIPGGGSQWYARILYIIVGVILSILLVQKYQCKHVLMLIVTFTMICVSWQVARIIGEHKITTWISRHNFTIYIYSWPFQAAVMMICEKLNLSWYLIALCMFVVGLMAPIVMICIYEHNRKFQNRFFDLVLGRK